MSYTRCQTRPFRPITNDAHVNHYTVWGKLRNLLNPPDYTL